MRHIPQTTGFGLGPGRRGSVLLDPDGAGVISGARDRNSRTRRVLHCSVSSDVTALVARGPSHECREVAAGGPDLELLLASRAVQDEIVLEVGEPGTERGPVPAGVGGWAALRGGDPQAPWWRTRFHPRTEGTMRWKTGRRSGNVEDRRGRGPIAVGGGIVGIVIVAAVVLLGGDPSAVAPLLEQGPGASEPPPEQSETADFVHVVLGSTEDVWNGLLGDAAYREPTLVLFSGRTSSACGLGAAAMGPFYCPADDQVYLDLTFFDDLAQMGAAGEFAAAYVIGHEVGHHVQNLLGTSDRVRQLQQGMGQVEANRLSVNLELQADCYAGVWAHHANRTQRMLEPGDVDDGLAAAEAIGDDRLLRRAGRDVVPEAFTHGSSEQRRTWLLRGIQSGDPASCDTF